MASFAAEGPHDTVEALVPALLAAGQLVVVDPGRFHARYEAVIDEALREGHPGSGSPRCRRSPPGSCG